MLHKLSLQGRVGSVEPGQMDQGAHLRSTGNCASCRGGQEEDLGGVGSMQTHKELNSVVYCKMKDKLQSLDLPEKSSKAVGTYLVGYPLVV